MFFIMCLKHPFYFSTFFNVFYYFSNFFYIYGMRFHLIGGQNADKQVQLYLLLGCDRVTIIGIVISQHYHTTAETEPRTQTKYQATITLPRSQNNVKQAIEYNTMKSVAKLTKLCIHCIPYSIIATMSISECIFLVPAHAGSPGQSPESR